ncbi:MAG: acyl carrier protein [Deltaproteobacteria bacterium]|nr:acyl carrier protein [Deltaproteobacteria bacterium]
MTQERDGVSVPPEVQDAVRRCVAQSLVLELEEVQLGSRLIDDLGADSLDFVDIIFMLEQALDVPMRDTELSFLTRLDYGSPEVMQRGVLTPEVVARLEPWLPALRELPDRAQVTPAQMFSCITIESICLVASGRLQRKDAES